MQTPVYVGNFKVVRPRYEKKQEDAVHWLANAHARAESEAGFPNGSVSRTVEFYEKLIARFGCSSDRISCRGHELSDFNHLEWEEMSIFNLTQNPTGSNIEVRQRTFDKLVGEKCELLFASHEDFAPDLVHVSCTGYLSPSPVQKFVVSRGAAQSTRVFHAYHMGCYAALPATRLATAFSLQQRNQPTTSVRTGVDVVHTELCTLHFNPLLHSPEQMVVQSLFADGFIRYRVGCDFSSEKRKLKVLSMNEEQVPDSADAMTWLPVPWGMAMTLSRDVPSFISGSIREFIERLIAVAGEEISSLLPRVIFAIHPGGPKIIDHIQQILEIADDKIEASRAVLRRYGNMSSATLPHIWKEILDDAKQYPAGSKVLSLAFGPGLTVAGSLFEIVGTE